MGVYPMVNLSLPLLADNLAVNLATAAGSFATTSWGWQWHQARQWVGEWLELQFTASPLNGWDLPEWLPPLGVQQAILGFVLGAILGWLGLLGWQLGRRYYRQWQRRSPPTATPGRDRNPDATRRVRRWLARSQQYERQGRYRDACDALYRALLHHLDETQIVPQLASRTDREYLRLLQTHPQFASYQTVIQTHEQVHFGDLAASSETWQRCQPAFQALRSR